MFFIPRHGTLLLCSPKAGSVTIVKALTRYCKIEGLDFYTHKNFGTREHLTRREIEQILFENDLLTLETNVLCLLRNPFSRLRSFFEFAKLDRNSLSWWDKGYDPSQGFLTQDEWMDPSNAAFLAYPNWTKVYRVENFSASDASNAPISYLCIDNRSRPLSEVLGQHFDVDAGKFAAADQVHNDGDELERLLTGGVVPDALKFVLGDQHRAMIQRDWQHDFEIGGYDPGPPAA